MEVNAKYVLMLHDDEDDYIFIGGDEFPAVDDKNGLRALKRRVNGAVKDYYGKSFFPLGFREAYIELVGDKALSPSFYAKSDYGRHKLYLSFEKVY